MRPKRSVCAAGVAGKSDSSEYFATVESYWVAERTFGGTAVSRKILAEVIRFPKGSAEISCGQGWRELAPMLEARANFGACATDDGAVVVAGGLSRPEGEMVDFTLRTAERFDCRRGRWAALPPMAEARQGCSCAAVAGGRVAAVGGKGLQSCELLEWHDSGRGAPEASWAQLPPMAIERGFASAAAWQPSHQPGRGAQPPTQLVVMGGQDSYWSVHKDGERLQLGPNGAAGGWGAPDWLAPLPEARKWTAMAMAALAL